jgi:hypothetical protein
MRMALFTTGIVVLLSAVGLHCSSDGAGLGGSCKSDGDCKSGLVCRSNICVEPSDECDPPCDPQSEACFHGECVSIGDPNDKDADGTNAGEDCDDSNHEIHPGATEYCDGVDNDCDGTTDEDCPPCTAGYSRPCGTDVGECSPGIQVCASGQWDTCSGQAPSPERCDGKDNDCDGMVDEVCPCDDGDELPCGVEEGECEPGVQRCAGGEWSGCFNGELPVPEVCDGLDNDCDGETDDGFIWVCGCSSNLDCPATERCIRGRCQMQEFISLTAGGGRISSSNYYLELFVAPAQPAGEAAGQSHDVYLGPGAIRGVR